MFLNYLKIAFRNLLKFKVFSLINISGLAIGMTCCLLIVTWVLDELSFDRFHQNYDTICRAVYRYKTGTDNLASVWGPTPVGPALVEEMPEVINATRYFPNPPKSLKHDNQLFTETVYSVDPNFFEIFTVPAIEGDLKTALDAPLSLVISRRIARKYFGTDQNVVGNVLKMANLLDFKVAAVIEDVPVNSHFDFDILASFDALKFLGWKMDDWRTANTVTYIQLQQGVSIKEFNEKIEGYLEIKNSNAYSVKLSFQPLSEIHLYSDFSGDYSKLGNITHVYVFSIIAVFVLLIACINFMNLSTARSSNRVKEIGIRKVVGGQRSHLIAQFYGESIFLSVLALGVSLVAVPILLPYFNDFSGKQLSLDLAGNWQMISGIIVITVMTGLVAGSYPAFFLSSFKPARVLQGSSRSTAKSMITRKVLVVMQFALSVVLIVSTSTINSQLQYIQNKDLGWDRENMLVIPWKDAKKLGNAHDTLKNELIGHPGVLGVTYSSQHPTNMEYATIDFEWRGKNPSDQIIIYYNVVTIDYPATMGLKIKEGRGFDDKIASDRSAGPILLNEEAVKVMGLEHPLEETITLWGSKANIIGVLENYHFQPVHKKIEPIILRPDYETRVGYTLIRLHPDRTAETIRFVKETWGSVHPGVAFDYNFLDEEFDRLYRAETRLGMLLNIFTILAVFIACLGLFGLASFTTEQRTKEIGIRKALGAPVINIIALLCKDFLKLVLIANLIAWPIAYYAMSAWLQDFAYRVNVSWLIFLIAAILSICIALFTVSAQSLRAASANPVNSLRFE